MRYVIKSLPESNVVLFDQINLEEKVYGAQIHNSKRMFVQSYNEEYLAVTPDLGVTDHSTGSPEKFLADYMKAGWKLIEFDNSVELLNWLLTHDNADL